MTDKITIYKIGNSFFSNKEEAIALAQRSSFGEAKEGKIVYSLFEVIYLIERNKAELLDSKNKKISFHDLIKKFKHNKEYAVFKDLRDKGMIVKEGLKFGTDFRLYEKSSKPGEAHAKYLVHVVEGKNLNLKDFCAKARIAHSTNKTLLLAILDSEGDVNYYGVNWKSIL
jgi:tRNA-intron endonuclease